MPRPRSFDDAQALEAAMHCFWRRGYQATSVRELGTCMGLTGPSLYNAFGDKQQLYQQALSHYLDTGVRRRLAQWEAQLAPQAAMVAFIEDLAQRATHDPEGRGCMLVNTALELSAHDDALRQLLQAEFASIAGFFERCAGAAQRNGTLATTLPAPDLARLLLAGVLGLRVLARSRAEPEQLEATARPLLALLCPPTTPARRTRRPAQPHRKPR